MRYELDAGYSFDQLEVERKPFNVHYFGQDRVLYRDKAAPIDGSRSSLFPGFQARFAPAVFQAANDYAEVADRHGLQPAHLALAFVRQQPFLASVLVAASSAEQLQYNLGAIDVKLDKDVVKQINAIHDSYPNRR